MRCRRTGYGGITRSKGCDVDPRNRRQLTSVADRPLLGRRLAAHLYMIQQALLLIVATLTVAGAEARRRLRHSLPWPAPACAQSFADAAPNSAPPGLLTTANFRLINEPGFGDKWNGWPWSMQWWRGKLYVGTGRAVQCLEYYVIHRAMPYLQRYPPRFDVDCNCAASAYDLPLQAEIWCYTPETRAWERLYQSPATVRLPGHPSSSVARDIGYRNMVVFTEPDGTEALYVAAVTAKVIEHAAPPPRLLRSTDGITFTPVPATPGTLMGDLEAEGLRACTIYRERLYVVAGRLFGDGIVLESTNPAGGDNHFRQVTPDGLRVHEMAVFNGFLYLGLRQPLGGYSVVKTDAAGLAPYRFTPVVPRGGGRGAWGSHSAMGMRVFQDRLYVGTEHPAELICIYPDDSWDVIAGRPRRTAAGMKYPLSGMGDGFDYALNRIVHRLEEHNGWLYVGLGSFEAVKARSLPIVGPLIRPYMGFDLLATRDGIHFTSVTRTGFDDPAGGDPRCFASTPHGLFLGVINEYAGAKVYLGAPQRELFRPFS